MASIVITNANYTLLEIVKLTSAPITYTPDDLSTFLYNTGANTLTVNGITQAELDEALVTYEASFVEPAVIDPLDTLKTLLMHEVDSLAGAARVRYITTAAGQSEIYITKADEAEAYIAASYPADLSAYPYIDAESTALGLTSTVVADTIINKRDSWMILSASIEAARLLGKQNIELAIDEATARSAKIDAMLALNAL